MDSLGIYVHFPFCIRKCLYCDFPSYAGQENLMDIYIHGLEKEIDNIKSLAKNRPVDTILFGGGTPTLFSGEILGHVLDNIKDGFNVLEDAEITTEANPETLDREKLTRLYSAGFNRLSIGMQESRDKHLKALGRGHSLEDVKRGVGLAHETGFNNINLDLIFALPDQTLEAWMESLEIAVNMGAQHISAYALIIEEGTPFYDLWKRGELNLPSDELEREMYHRAVEYLGKVGYRQYEISNFAREGMECRHNLKYWRNLDYIGIGSGAHSSLGGHRWANFSDIERYIGGVNSKGTGIEESHRVPPKEQRFETIMMGLRLVQGVSKAAFLQRFGNDIGYYYGSVIRSLEEKGLLVDGEDSVYLTSKGMDLQNQVLLYFLD